MNLECDCGYYIAFEDGGDIASETGEGKLQSGTCANCGVIYEVAVYKS